MRLIKNLIPLFVLILLVLSCTETDKFNDYSVYIKNESGVTVNVTSYLNNVQIDAVMINNNSRSFTVIMKTLHF